jgi:hypothetical protein
MGLGGFLRWLAVGFIDVLILTGGSLGLADLQRKSMSRWWFE